MKNLHRALVVGAAVALMSGCLNDGSPAAAESKGTADVPGSESSVAAGDAFRQDTMAYLEQLEAKGFAGALLVARGDTALVHAGVGMADLASKRPWTTGTVSDIGSITKQFTGAAILALQEDGALSVSDSIMEYFPAVPQDKASITVHQLLTHSSGLVDPPLGDWDPVDREEYVRRTLSAPLDFEPGTSYAYSNAGYSLLAAIIEMLTGKPYESYLRERFFLPAAMEDTGYLLPGWGDERIAVGYRGVTRWGTTLERPMGEDGPFWALRGNGGIHSTTGDMWRWARALLDGAVLSEASMEAYWSPWVDEGYGDSFYGYGWVVIEDGPGGNRLITHNGGNDIFFADMAIYPDLQVVMVLLTNVAADWPQSDRLLEYVSLRLLQGERYPDLSVFD